MNPLVYEVMLHLTVVATVLAPTGVSAQSAPEGGDTRSPYAGEYARSIKSLSDEDLAELRRGGGWGLARAAELNGIPGPAHLLELQDQIPLSEEQVEKIDGIFLEMRSRAIAEGQRLIEQEQALEGAFRAGTVDEASLRKLLSSIASSRSELRFIHLAAHLETLPLLTEAQVARYQVLRGYSDDPCAKPPAGHDPTVWRRHHGCS